MLLTELQTYSLTHLAKLPFSSTSSTDNSFSFISEKGVDILGGVGKASLLRWLLCFILVTSFVPVSAEDATPRMFERTDGLPAAFGDFNSDELTDLFVIREDGSTLDILLSQDKEPIMKSKDGYSCHFGSNIITSVVPGDFDGDALMDVMVTVMDKKSIGNGGTPLNNVIILKGMEDKLICNNTPIFQMVGQPLAIDYDRNMIIDLFGLDKEGQRSYWLFNNETYNPKKIPMKLSKDEFSGEIRNPHSHAFLDLDGDQLADLYVTTNEKFEIWRGNENKKDGFTPWKTIELPPGYSKNKQNFIGQTVFLDVELKGKLDHLVPICYDSLCKNNSIVVYHETDNGPKWFDLRINFIEPGSSKHWHFTLPKNTMPYTGAITMRPGDFDMDGYPDLLATLTSDDGEFKSFFFKNVPCKTFCSEFSRTFEIQWTDLNPYNNNTILGVFFDFMQDGVLDIIFVHYNPSLPKKYDVSAFMNTAIYDANFMKVMVITGLTNKNKELTVGSLRKYKKIYGTNLPGPKVFYETTTQEGDPRKAVATQIPQSAHHSLNLPYTIFGLGRTPNFIENLTVQVYGNQREWNQLIPNSQMVVIPWPIDQPNRWKVQLFVTPSKLIYQSVLALLATCVVISIIIAVLYWKERKEDHLEKLQEAHRFHFDAM